MQKSTNEGGYGTLRYIVMLSWLFIFAASTSQKQLTGDSDDETDGDETDGDDGGEIDGSKSADVSGRDHDGKQGKKRWRDGSDKQHGSQKRRKWQSHMY